MGLVSLVEVVVPWSQEEKTNWPTVRILNGRSTKITKISLLGASDLGIESGNGNGPKAADPRFLIPRLAI